MIPLHFYAFHDLKDGIYFFVGENKSLPGRDEKAEADAHGRSFGVAWFEKMDDAPDGVLVHRVAREGHSMDLLLQTPAELIRAAGCAPPVITDATARAIELALESRFLDYSLTRFEHRREIDVEEDPFVFTLTNPVDAEQIMWGERKIEDFTKMALARRLEVCHGQNRLECYNTMTKAMMLAELDPEYDGLDVDVALGPALRGGRGRGRGGRGGGAAPAGEEGGGDAGALARGGKGRRGGAGGRG